MSWEEDRIGNEICHLLIFRLKPMNAYTEECGLVKSALYAAKTTLPRGTLRRLFIQEFAASLNRKHTLPNENVEKFHKLGFQYMEI